MINLLNIDLATIVRIKNIPFIPLAIFASSYVVTASGFAQVQVPGANFIQQNQPSTINRKFVEGEVLVKYKSNVSVLVQQYTATNLGGLSSKSAGGNSQLAKIKLPQGSDLMTAIQAFQADANVEHAQPNYIYHATAIPNDTNYGQLWGMNNTGQTVSNQVYPTNNPGISGLDIDAELAWDEITDCSSTVVAVIDTGINYTHLDLAANMWDGGISFPNHGWDFVGDDVVPDDNDPMPTAAGEDHGTHVAGTIGAIGNNALGVAGVCWQASIMSVRVLDETGIGTTANIILGVGFAVDNGAKVINMSLGGEGTPDPLLIAAITDAEVQDVVVVVAAGNGGANGIGDDNDGLGGDTDPNTIFQPCGYSNDNLLCVAALDQSYSLASFSNFGAISVDLGAPGTNILSGIAGKVIEDDLTGWVPTISTVLGSPITSGWTSGTCAGTPTIPRLFNTSDWCTSDKNNGPFYELGLDDRAIKTFDLSGTTSVKLSAVLEIDTVNPPLIGDFFNIRRNGDGDPFGAGNTPLLQFSGSNLDSPETQLLVRDISSCNTATCALGIQLISDPDGDPEPDPDKKIRGRGVSIQALTFTTVQTGADSYSPFVGTSMATPHVTGIAAMVRAYNPNYTYIQTVEAIKNGGEVVAALSGLTTTGRAANAMGAIAYIPEPTGLVAIVQ